MKLIFTILLLSIQVPLFAQIQTSELLKELLIDELDRIPPAFGGEYTPAEAVDKGLWESVWNEISASNYSNAATLASELDYELLEVDSEPSGVMYVLRRKETSLNYWGTYVFNPNNSCSSPLIIQAPHPKADLNTGEQAIHAFIYTQAKALFLSGAHRCNSSNASGCDGNSSVCTGSSESYRISDPAHAVDHIFHSTTQYLNETYPEAVFLQLHGFAKKETDPFVIMSNGTSFTASTDFSSTLKGFLLAEDNTLSFKIAHIDTDWTRLIGMTNVQGRLINSSPGECDEAATSSSGRFLHMEQEFDKLRSSSQKWNRVAIAISNTFDCAENPVLSINNWDFSEEIMLYPNPFVQQIRIETVHSGILNLKIWNVHGRLVQRIEFVRNIQLNPLVNPGIYYYVIERNSTPVKSGKIIKI